MKKGIKWCLVGGIACLLIGAGISTAALAMGADLRYYSNWDYGWEHDWDFDADVESFEGVTSLKLDCKAGQVELQTGGVDKLTLKSEKAGRYSWKLDGDTLKIESNERHMMNDRRRLIIQVPEAAMWDEFVLDMKAGSFHADELLAKQAKLDVKAGSVEIKSGTLDRLSAEIQAGHILCQAVVGEEADIDCAAGDVYVWLQGTAEDYHTTVDCNVGTVQIGNQSLAAIKGEKHYNKGEERQLDIECSTGAVFVEFTE